MSKESAMRDQLIGYLVDQLARSLDNLADFIDDHIGFDKIDIGRLVCDNTTSDADRLLIRIATSKTYRDETIETLEQGEGDGELTEDQIADLAQRLLEATGDLEGAMRVLLEACG